MTPPPRIPDAILALLEQTLNGYLALDPEGAARLAPLAGRLIGIEIAGFGLSATVIPREAGVQLFGEYDAPPDCLIRGTPLGLLRMTLSERKEAQLQSGEVVIEGDTALAHDFSAALAGLQVDWEEQLARILGDPVARHLGNRARAARQWGARTSADLTDDLRDYLQEESRLLPTRDEIQAFLSQVDLLRDDEERLSARIERLARQTNARS